MNLMKLLSEIKLTGTATDPKFKEQVLQVIAIVDEVRAELDGDSDTSNSTD